MSDAPSYTHRRNVNVNTTSSHPYAMSNAQQQGTLGYIEGEWDGYAGKPVGSLFDMNEDYAAGYREGHADGLAARLRETSAKLDS